MRAQLLDGRALAQSVVDELKKRRKSMTVVPGLAVVLVGNDPSSHLYVSIKEERARELGVYFYKYVLPADTGDEEVLSIIEECNKDERVHGILLQLPLPKAFSPQRFISAILPEKDVDGLLPLSPCASPVIQAIGSLLKATGKELLGKTASLLVKNNIFCQGIEKELFKLGISVISSSQEADVVVTALGRPGYLTPDMLKEGATVIDVGMFRDSGKVEGDVSQEVYDKASFVSPVPGGVGPLTVAYLFANLFSLAQK